ncbi:MAG: glycosyltransferase family 4 protein [Halobacteriaceae archaeon]
MTTLSSMPAFSEMTLLVVGRSVRCDGSHYYMNPAHRDLLQGMGEEFGEAIYLCQRVDVSPTEVNHSGRIDDSILRVEANDDWAQSSSTLNRLASLVTDARFVRNLSGTIVTYTYYPGFYSFLLSPVIFRIGDFNIGHFGSDAIDTAKVAYGSGLSGRSKARLYRWLQSYVVGNIDCIFATDPRMADEYGADTIRESKPLINFSDTDFHSPEITMSEPIELLSVGVFRPVKGYSHLIDAVGWLADRSELNFNLRIVGDGQMRPEIEQKVDSMGLENVVVFPGYIEDEERLAQYYSSADIFVHSSLKESVPRVFYEATLMGLPIVSTNAGGIPSFFDHRTHAMLTEPADGEALGRAIDELASDPQLAQTLVENAQQKIEWYVNGSPVSQRMGKIEDRFRS